MSISLIILDELSFSPGFGPASVWIHDSGPGRPQNQRWYQDYSSWAKYSNANSSTYGSLSVTFEGSVIAFTGNTPPSTQKQTFSVSIDDAYIYVASYPFTHTYMQWYMSPMLEEGAHTITLTEMDGTDVDYALIGVGNQTNILGKDILVDSISDRIVWTGDWQTNTSTLIHASNFHIVNYPLGNSTKDSRTVGDSFSFKFSGTTVSVFGIQRNSINGSISTDFKIDGGKATTFSTTSASLGSDLANTMLFSSQILDFGIHILVMNITTVTGDQSLKLDYITYSNRKFDTNALSSPSGSSASLSSSNQPSSSNTSDPTPKATNFKRIVGIVGGGITLLLIIAGVLLLWRKKRQACHRAQLMYSSQPFTCLFISGPDLVYLLETDFFQDNQDQSIIRQTESFVPAHSKPKQNFNTRRRNEGMPVVRSTSTVDPLAHRSPLSPTLSRRGSASDNQAEIRRRPDVINSSIAQRGQPSTEMTQIQELRNRIEMLTEENMRLMDVPPPAYEG
ncbi:hypothetical protein IW261DRAFT_1574339 [Armillaria novae-zelandiae]|uniref:Transmembrane protein n=1 Tax=Armillaria novae-zelandiae TaxID=153914 RepID=A0AA39TYE5_9AGAR|nr:hypothetical protein IW261DRAFT_1574339 [Armillaria novae-zelandiae]